MLYQLEFTKVTGEETDTKKIAAALILRLGQTPIPKQQQSPYGQHTLMLLENSQSQGIVQLCPHVLHLEFDKLPAQN